MLTASPGPSLDLVEFKKLQGENNSLTLANLRTLIEIKANEEKLLKTVEAWVDRFITDNESSVISELSKSESLKQLKMIVDYSQIEVDTQVIRLAKFALAQLESQAKAFSSKESARLLLLRINQIKVQQDFSSYVSTEGPIAVLDSKNFLAPVTVSSTVVPVSYEPVEVIVASPENLACSGFNEASGTNSQVALSIKKSHGTLPDDLKDVSLDNESHSPTLSAADRLRVRAARAFHSLFKSDQFTSDDLLVRETADNKKTHEPGSFSI